MTGYRELTPERLACLRVIESARGNLDHEAEELKPFCDDKSTLTTPDVFNQCHNAGWLVSRHDSRFDASTVYLTKEGSEVLSMAAECEVCKGTGKEFNELIGEYIIGSKCERCDGSGTRVDKEKDVRTP